MFNTLGFVSREIGEGSHTKTTYFELYKRFLSVGGRVSCFGNITGPPTTIPSNKTLPLNNLNRGQHGFLYVSHFLSFLFNKSRRNPCYL